MRHHCCDLYKQGLLTKKSHHEWSLIHECHAERNAIDFCAKYGISAEGCIMYCTHSPCVLCVKSLIQVGIKEIVYINEYKDINVVKEICEDSIVLTHFGM